MTLQQGVELAEIDMPAMYRLNGKPSMFQRVRKFLKPGPKPKLKQVTYRGRASTLLNTMNHLGDFRQDPVSFDTLNKMRKNPMVKLATIVRAAPILTALRETRIECESREIEAFIREVFVDTLLLAVAETSIIPSYQFGTSPHEKVWENRQVKATYVDEDGNEVVAWDGQALVYKKVKFVHPETLKDWIVEKETGDFRGFEQKPRPGDDKKRIVEDWKAFVYVNRFLYGGLWGEAELSDVYAYWYYEEFFRALQADYLRFKTIPPIIGYAPPGVRQDEQGDDIDNLTYAGEVLQAALDNLVVVLPYEADERGNQMWSYQEMQLSEKSEIYTKAIEELGVMILRGMIVPERTVTQNAAAVGSYNQAAIHSERMLDAAKMEVDKFLLACNLWLVPQLVEDNFGPSAPPCKLFANATSEALKEKLHNIVITVLQNDREGRFARQVAFAELLDFLNIPFTSGDTGLPEPAETPEEEDET